MPPALTVALVKTVEGLHTFSTPENFYECSFLFSQSLTLSKGDILRGSFIKFHVSLQLRCLRTWFGPTGTGTSGFPCGRLLPFQENLCEMIEEVEEKAH